LIYVLITAGLLSGLLLVFGIPAGEMAKEILKYVKPKNTSLKAKINTITGRKKRNFVIRAFHEAREILELTGRSQKYTLVCRLSIIMALLGGLVSILMGNILLLPVLTIGFSLLPLWHVKFSMGSYKKHLNSELETALSVISTSYVRSGDIQKAVKENVDQLRPPVSGVFKRFLAEVGFVDANVTAAILHMKESINSRIFHDWCDTLIDCRKDRFLAPALINCVDKFSDLRSVQAEFEMEAYAPFKEFVTMALLTLVNVPLTYFINRSWFNIAMHHIAGQAMLAITAVVLFAGLAKVVGITKPIEWKG
jgi:hypothetical protein